MRGLDYMLELVRHVPPDAITWTWDGEAQSISQGRAAMVVSWGDFFLAFDGKDSKVVGLMEAARVLAAARIWQGTTRHFPATEWTINNAMGSEPKLPAWVEMSNDIIPGELGKLLSGQYRDAGQCMATIKERVDRLAAQFRKG